MVLHGIALHLMIVHSPSCHCIVSYGVAWYCIVGFGARAVSRKTPTFFIFFRGDHEIQNDHWIFLTKMCFEALDVRAQSQGHDGKL